MMILSFRFWLVQIGGLFDEVKGSGDSATLALQRARFGEELFRVEESAFNRVERFSALQSVNLRGLSSVLGVKQNERSYQGCQR